MSKLRCLYLLVENKAAEDGLRNFDKAVYESIQSGMYTFFNRVKNDVDFCMQFRNGVIIGYDPKFTNDIELSSKLTSVLCSPKGLGNEVHLGVAAITEFNPRNFIDIKNFIDTEFILRINGIMDCHWNLKNKNQVNNPVFPGMEDTMISWNRLHPTISKPALFIRRLSTLVPLLEKTFEPITEVYEFS